MNAKRHARAAEDLRRRMRAMSPEEFERRLRRSRPQFAFGPTRANRHSWYRARRAVRPARMRQDVSAT